MNALSIIAEMTEWGSTAYLLHQNKLKDTRDYGGYIAPDRGYCEPGSSASAVDCLVSIRAAGQTSHSTADLEEAVLLYLDHLLSCQHSDGTLDLRETNFHCTATLAFTLQYLADTFRLLSASQEEFEQAAAAQLKTYILKGIPALAASGFHTPNHRWVIASAISHVLQLSEDSLLAISDAEREGLNAELNRYLGEGIDMDDCGEYTEKSAGIYNVACNDSLLIMARSDRHTELLQYVKRNLDLMPAYVEPDGTIFTLKSTRQDSNFKIYPHRYYANYLEYGWLAKESSYRARGISLLNEAASCGAGEARNMLTRVLLYPEIIENLPAPEPFEKKVKYFNQDFGLYRDIRGTHSLTAATDSSRFMKVHKGANSVILRLSATFFGPRGQFIPTEIKKVDEHKVKLHQTSVWGYTRPFDQPQASSVWAEMDWDARERSYMQSFEVDADISISDEGTTLSLNMDGPRDMLYRIELIFPAGGHFETESALLPGTAGAGGILKTGECRYRLGNDSIKISGGFAEHLRGQDLRGGESQDPDAFTLYCTGYIPDKRLLVFS